MIKPINITVLNTTTQAYFDCDHCGAKETISIGLINTNNKYELENLKKERCPYCNEVFGISGLPKLNAYQVDGLIKKLFKKEEITYPLDFYIHLLFDNGSQHSHPTKFSQRIDSLCKFITKGNSNKNDLDRITVGKIFMVLSKYFSSEGYISPENFHNEYQECLTIWGQYFNQ